MKLLLDKQCWLWWFAQPERLNEEAIARIADESKEYVKLELYLLLRQVRFIFQTTKLHHSDKAIGELN